MRQPDPSSSAFHWTWRPLRLFTLGPLHVGTGEDLTPMEYVVDGRNFYRLDQRTFFDLVRRLDDGPQRLADWTDEQFAAMRDLRDNREQSRLINAVTPRAFFERVGQRQLLLDYLHRQPAQEFRPDDDNRRGRREGIGQVRAGVRAAGSGQLYLPGSSLKGALRTALLYDWLQRNGEEKNIERLVRDRLNDRDFNRRGQRFANTLEAEVFFCGQREGKRTRQQEAQMDLLRFIAVADAFDAEPETARGGVAKVNIYLVEQERRGREKTGRLVASRQRQATYAEIIPGGRELRTQLGVDATSLAWLAQQLRGDHISRGDNDYYRDLPDKFRRLFNVDLGGAAGAGSGNKEQGEADHPPKRLAEAMLDHCFAALDRFTRAQLARQTDWLDDYRNQTDPGDYGDRIAAGYAPVFGYEGLRMHLGYAAGFGAVTALLYFLEDRGKRELFEQVMAKFNLGNRPGNRGRYQPKISRFPKSRRLAEGETKIQPLGWLAVLTPDAPRPELTFPTRSTVRSGSAASGETARSEAKPAASVPTGPQYFSGKLNYKRPPELDAVVVQSGRPNKVQVYLTPENRPVVELTAYRQPLAVGTVVRVLPQVTKKGVVLNGAFRKLK